MLYLHSQAKEAEGTETDVPAEVKEKLTELTMDLLRPLKVSQLKEVSTHPHWVWFWVWLSLPEPQMPCLG